LTSSAAPISGWRQYKAAALRLQACNGAPTVAANHEAAIEIEPARSSYHGIV